MDLILIQKENVDTFCFAILISYTVKIIQQMKYFNSSSLYNVRDIFCIV